MYCDTSINYPDEFVEWLDYQDAGPHTGFNYTSNTIYKDFNSYDEAFEVITWIINGLKFLDKDGVEFGSEDIVTGFEIKMNPQNNYF